jgi:centrosomal protein CEP104
MCRLRRRHGGLAWHAQPPPGWPGDLPAPEEVGPANAGDAAALEALAGEYVAAAAENWQLRDAAQKHLAAMTANGELTDKPGA